MEEEAQENAESVDNTSQQTQQTMPDFSAEFAALKAEFESLKSQQFAQQTKPVQQAQAPKLTAEQAQALKENPELMAQWLEAQAVQAKNEIRKESSKQIWDRRTEEKYPLLKTDKEFQKRVTAQMREMTAQGEYGNDDPMLLYRATQIAASEYIPAKSSATRSSGPTSVESRMTSQRSESVKPKIDDNDPRVQFAKVLGISGAKLDKFKAQLGPYTPTQRRPTRRLSK